MAEVDDTKNLTKNLTKNSAVLNTRSEGGIIITNFSFKYCYIQSEERKMFPLYCTVGVYTLPTCKRVHYLGRLSLEAKVGLGP